MRIRNDANLHGRGHPRHVILLWLKTDVQRYSRCSATPRAAVSGVLSRPTVPVRFRTPRRKTMLWTARETNLRSIGHAFADGVTRPRRRGFIALAGGAAAWTMLGRAAPGARAQAMPVIGYLRAGAAEARPVALK